MVHLQIDPRSGVAVYRQLMDQLRYYIASGVLPPGTQLPSIRALAKQLAVNPATIVKAYTELDRAGVIEMRQGAGAFVKEVSEHLDAAEKEAALWKAARRIAVEAKQLDATEEMVIRVVREALAEIREKPEPSQPGDQVEPNP